MILHSFHGVQERRERERDRKIERETREKKGGMGEGREGRRGGGRQERKFNLAPDSISIPDSQPHSHSHKISTLC